MTKLKAATEIRQIETDVELSAAFDSGLIEVFQQCFALPPYYQYHTNDDIREYFEEYRVDGVLYLSWRTQEVVGFTASLPLIKASIFKAEMILQGIPGSFGAEFLRDQMGSNPEKIEYVADLGVRSDCRYQNIGSKLLETLLNHFPPDTPWVLRVLKNIKHTQNFYEKFGFEPLPVIQTVSYLHQDQTYHTNQRLILAKNKRPSVNTKEREMEKMIDC